MKNIKRYYIDRFVIKSRTVKYVTDANYSPTGLTVDPYDVSEIIAFEKYLIALFSKHDLNKSPVVLNTCEGFNTEENIRIISKIAKQVFGKEYYGKVIFENGSFTHHKKSFRNGIWIVPNVAFTYNEVGKQLKNHIPDQIDYDRPLTKAYSVLYARSSYDRFRIFDHAIRNHRNQADLIFKYIDVGLYSGLLNEDATVYVNQKYNDVYANRDNEYNSEDTARYILYDMKFRMKNCFVNLISETNYYENNSCWFTEKTVLPIILGFPFVTSTTCGYYDLLRDFGLKTFEDFWDESFNSITDHKKRCDAYLNTVDYIVDTYNTPQKRRLALEQMKPILEHNKKIMVELYENDYQSFLSKVDLTPEQKLKLNRAINNYYPHIDKWV